MSDIDLLTDAELTDLRAQVADAAHMQRGLVAFGRQLDVELDKVNAKIAESASRSKRRALYNQARTIEHVIAMYQQIDGSE